MRRTQQTNSAVAGIVITANVRFAESIKNLIEEIMNIEKERELFFKWFVGELVRKGKSQSEAEESAKAAVQHDLGKVKFKTWLARAALDTNQQGQPCRIISANLSDGFFTLQMTNPDFSVSAGPKLLCDAPEGKE